MPKRDYERRIDIGGSSSSSGGSIHTHSDYALTTHAHSLDDLGDVDAPSPGDGEVLAWNDSSGAWEPSSAGAGDMLKAVYDSDDDGVVDEAAAVEGVDTAGNSKYYGTNSGGTAGFYDLPAGGVSELDDLTDVDTSTSAPTEGQVLTWDNTANLWKPATPSGGSGGRYFCGATGDVGTASTSAYATKGSYFTPSVDLSVTHLLAYVDPASTSEEFYGQISEVNAVGSGSVTSILGTTGAAIPASTDMRRLRLAFSTAISLEASKIYMLSITRSNPSPTGTSVLRISAHSSNQVASWDINAPGEQAWLAPGYNTVGLSVSQTPSVEPAGKYCIAIEGFIV